MIDAPITGFCGCLSNLILEGLRAADYKRIVILYEMSIRKIHRTNPWQLLTLTPINSRNQKRTEASGGVVIFFFGQGRSSDLIVIDES